jgi:hypothetical protein
VPFTFLSHEGGDEVLPPPPPPKSKIEPLIEKQAFEISWPNVMRIEHVYAPRLTLDLARVELLRINAAETATLAELAPVMEGKPDVTRLTEIQLDDLSRRFRFQRIVFETARDVYDRWRIARQEYEELVRVAGRWPSPNVCSANEAASPESRVWSYFRAASAASSSRNSREAATNRANAGTTRLRASSRRNGGK